MAKKRSTMRVLVIGGSGFVSGAMVRLAQAQGHEVWTVTRGKRPLPAGVHALTADRDEPSALQAAIAGAAVNWDLAIDCIGFKPHHARQDVDLLSSRVGHLVFISTDFVFDPQAAKLPRHEEMPHTLDPGYGHDKSLCEKVLLRADTGAMRWSVLRPCHIYGPGSLLGCLPRHGRDATLLDRLRHGQALHLVGGGHFLQQPIYVDDLVRLALGCAGRDVCHRQAYCTAGPDIIESRRYYQIIADLLGVRLDVEEIPVASHLEEHPEHKPFLAHRIYSLSKLRDSGLPMPSTSIEQGLEQHLHALLH